MAIKGCHMGILAIHPYHEQKKSKTIKLGFPIISYSDRIFTVSVGRIALKYAVKWYPFLPTVKWICILQ